ncbi:hypothetical protein C8Q80DRAFT_1273636 [Daedaleopsis nitida]|nr:hypothetical protein C8Q80DRAFT_1273636 [Daedaleopsis nitida]
MVRLALTFISTLLAAAALVAGAGIPRNDEPALEAIPAGTPDGFYVGRLAANGSTIWEFIGDDGATINPTNFVANSSALAAAAASPSSGGLVKRDSLQCAGYGVNADQVNIAQGMLADMCGNGYYFDGRSIARVYADGVAYGCNYTGSQICRHNDLWLYFGFVNSRCGFVHGGSAGAGWYRIDKSKNAAAINSTNFTVNSSPEPAFEPASCAPENRNTTYFQGFGLPAGDTGLAMSVLADMRTTSTGRAG